jgi:hypothetical protein
MKLINNISRIMILGAATWLTACEDPDYIQPDTTVAPTNLSSNVLLVNASPDAPSLDLFINNEKIGGSVSAGTAQSGYTNVAIASNGGVANAAIRAKATSGTIGGVLDGRDLIYRAGNNNINNFSASDSAFYTFVVLDSITRPAPLRTNNALGIADTTYFNPLTGSYIAGVTRAPLPAAQKSRTVAVGTVPLGSTDVGGLRFLVITDQLPLPSTTRLPKPAANQAAIRLIHASPNTGAVTMTLGVTTYPTSSLTPGLFTYPMLFATAFNPAVGSRSTTATTFVNVSTTAPINVGAPE